jgi:predicted ATPase
MLTEYQISNFKAFSGPATIPIKPITLIFGPNSSGKSSIFQSLLMQRQSILYYKGFDSYKEIIHGHNTDNNFSFKVTLNRSEALESLTPFDSVYEDLRDDNKSERFDALFSTGNFNSIGLKIIFSYDGKSNANVQTIQLFMGNDLHPLFTYHQDKSLEDRDNSWDGFYLKNINFTHDFWKDCLIDSGEVPLEINEGTTNVFNIIEKSKKTQQKEMAIAFLSEILGVNHDFIFLRGYLPMDYRGMFIKEIQNHFIYEDDYFGHDTDPGNFSMYTVAAAFAFKTYLERIVHIGPIRDRYPDMEYDQETMKRINMQLELFDIGYSLKQVRFTSHADDIQDEFRTYLYDKKNNVHVSLKDVGVGVSQVLPVILQSTGSRNKTLLIEQPELHLHPALQTELGDVFINAAMGKQKNTFLIETHSEHLILRILRRIRETAAGELPEGMPAITPDDVAVLYIKPGKDGSEVIHIPVNEDGEFDKPWPDGFFSERARELF